LGYSHARWLKRILGANKLCGQISGPSLICDEEVVRSLTSRDMNVLLHDLRGKLLKELLSPLFLSGVKPARIDVEEKYNVYRSVHRGSDSRAMAMNVGEKFEIDVVNWWTNKEAAGTSCLARTISRLC
jgi:hypothetical protein